MKKLWIAVLFLLFGILYYIPMGETHAPMPPQNEVVGTHKAEVIPPLMSWTPPEADGDSTSRPK